MTKAQRTARAKKAGAASAKVRSQRAKEMKRLSHPRTLDSEAVKALTYAIGQSCVGILSRDQTVIGTGTLIDVDGQTAILTAQHVIGDSDLKALRFFVPRQGAEIGDSFEDVKRRIRPKHIVAPVQLEFKAVYAESGIDLALLILAPNSKVQGWPRSRKLHRGPITSATPLLLMG